MKKTSLLLLGVVFSITVLSQRYITKNGHIQFYSETPMETIEAHNRQVNSALDLSTGDFVFKVLMKSFEFEKALMQEHFNENYVESDKFPRAEFEGRILNFSSIDFSSQLTNWGASSPSGLETKGLCPQKRIHSGTTSP